MAMAVDSSTEPSSSLPLQQIESRKQETKTNELPAVEVDGNDMTAKTATKKTLAFYLGFLALNINALVFSLDATSLAVALPVSSIYLSHHACPRYFCMLTLARHSPSRSN